MSWEKRKNGYWIDHDTRKGFVATRGPFDTLAEAVAEFEELPHELRYRLRGPNNTVYVESNSGNVFRHSPPITFRNNR
jgi:hypothetical protein